MKIEDETIQSVEGSAALNFLCKILLLEKCFSFLLRKNTQEQASPTKKILNIHSKKSKCCDCATDKKDKTMKKLFLLIAALIIPFSVAQATEEDTEIEVAFTVADVFPNGLIDGGEFDIYNLKTFESLDMDGTKSLDREECMGGCFPNNIAMNGTSGAVIRYPFMALDGNKSESVAPDEYIAHGRNQFKVYDDDKNSSLDKKEFAAFYQGLKDRTFIAEKNDGKSK